MLGPGEVHFFLTHRDWVTDPGFVPACQGALSAQELLRASRYKTEQDRLLALASRAQLRSVLSWYLNRPAASFGFGLDGFGKPQISPDSPGSGLGFSLSHTKNLSVLALTQGDPVGTDIESLDRRVNLKVANRFFDPKEVAWLGALPRADQGRAFLRLWTLKEAFIKADGRGLGLGLDTACFDLSLPGQIAYALKDPVGKGLKGCWQFFGFLAEPGAVAAVAVQSDRRPRLRCFACHPFDRLDPMDVQSLALSVQDFRDQM